MLGVLRKKRVAAKRRTDRGMQCGGKYPPSLSYFAVMCWGLLIRVAARKRTDRGTCRNQKRNRRQELEQRVALQPEEECGGRDPIRLIILRHHVLGVVQQEEEQTTGGMQCRGKRKRRPLRNKTSRRLRKICGVS